MNLHDALKKLKNLPHKENGQVYITKLAPLINEIGCNHDLAVALWQTKDKNARELAVRIANPAQTSSDLLDAWVGDLEGWALTDSFTGCLVVYTQYAIEKAHQWAAHDMEYERRAAFATMAQMAWSKNDFADEDFIGFLPLIEFYATDRRLHVKKAVNWALRDIGKRNENLQKHAQKLALKLQKSDHKTARWVGTHRANEFMKV